VAVVTSRDEHENYIADAVRVKAQPATGGASDALFARASIRRRPALMGASQLMPLAPSARPEARSSRDMFGLAIHCTGQTITWGRRRMKRSLLILMLAVVWTVPADARAAGDARTNPHARTIARRIAGLLDRLPHTETQVSALVVEADTGQVLYERDARRAIIPASNQKLLVLVAAADYAARADGAFVTRLAVRGSDLVIVGDGDPGLADRALAEGHGRQPLAFVADWAAAARRAGLSQPGHLIVDATILDDVFVHPDWEADDLVKWYGAPVGGLNLNDNCVELTVWPAPRRGDAAIWSIFPTCPLARVINRATSAAGQTSRRHGPVVARRPDAMELVLSGKVTRRGTLQSIPVVQPNRFAACAIREALRQSGVTVDGPTRFERVRDRYNRLPADDRVIAETRTGLDDVMMRIGHDSQNMFAEALAKRLGYEHDLAAGNDHPMGSWDSARRAILDTLARAGVDASRIRVRDASGLSRRNRLSAADLVALLRYAHRHPRRDLFLASLAGNRTGGRLRRIFASVRGDIYAKTGYMRGIRALSGLVRGADDRWYAFSVLFNGFPGPSTPYFRIQQQVARVLADEGRSEP